MEDLLVPDFSDRSIITTSDGSHSLKLGWMDEHYHSTHGALQESRHVFIQNGLMALDNSVSPINILEVGMGTGLNALLALQYSIQNQRPTTTYVALEPYPLVEKEFSLLNFPEAMNAPELTDSFSAIHKAPWQVAVQITPEFTLIKQKQGVNECILQNETFDLVFFDAFAPDVQPELWTPQIFEKLAHAMKPGSILVTYCAKGSVRRAMKAAGMKIERLAGPPGKREMTRAVLS